MTVAELAVRVRRCGLGLRNGAETVTERKSLALRCSVTVRAGNQVTRS